MSAAPTSTLCAADPQRLARPDWCFCRAAPVRRWRSPVWSTDWWRETATQTDALLHAANLACREWTSAIPRTNRGNYTGAYGDETYCWLGARVADRGESLIVIPGGGEVSRRRRDDGAAAGISGWGGRCPTSRARLTVCNQITHPRRSSGMCTNSDAARVNWRKLPRKHSGSRFRRHVNRPVVTPAGISANKMEMFAAIVHHRATRCLP